MKDPLKLNLMTGGFITLLPLSQRPTTFFMENIGFVQALQKLEYTMKALLKF